MTDTITSNRRFVLEASTYDNQVIIIEGKSKKAVIQEFDMFYKRSGKVITIYDNKLGLTYEFKKTHK